MRIPCKKCTSCQYSNQCTSKGKRSYSIGLYDYKTGDLIRPIRYLNSVSCRKAEEVCLMLQVKHPEYHVLYDRA